MSNPDNTKERLDAHDQIISELKESILIIRQSISSLDASLGQSKSTLVTIKARLNKVLKSK